MALEAVKHLYGGDLVLHHAPELCSNAAFLAKAIPYAPVLISKVPVDLPEFPTLLREALKQDVGFLDGCPELMGNKKLVEQLLDEGYPIYTYAARFFPEDVELYKKGIGDCPMAMVRVSPRISGNKDLVKLAVEKHGEALLYADPSVWNDRDLKLLALKTNGIQYLNYKDTDTDVEFVVEAVKGRFENLDNVPDAVKSNPAFVDRLAAECPAALQRDPALAGQAYQRHPELRAKQDVYKKLGIDFPSRFHSQRVLDEIIANRTKPRPPEDKRPTAVVVFPKTDHNNAFEYSGLENLLPGHRVLYYEAGTDEAAVAAVRDATSREGEAAILALGGHGSRTALALGAPDPATTAMGSEASYLDFSDRDQLIDPISKALGKNGHLVLVSCSTGAGNTHSANLANLLWEMVPFAHVWAPEEPSNVTFKMNTLKQFASADYLGVPTFHMPPLA